MKKLSLYDKKKRGQKCPRSPRLGSQLFTSAFDQVPTSCGDFHRVLSLTTCTNLQYAVRVASSHGVSLT